jgi:hypothetical protein
MFLGGDGGIHIAGISHREPQCSETQFMARGPKNGPKKYSFALRKNLKHYQTMNFESNLEPNWMRATQLFQAALQAVFAWENETPSARPPKTPPDRIKLLDWGIEPPYQTAEIFMLRRKQAT